MNLGMQYMLEIWTPSRKVTPVYYCILCEYLVTNWTVHCTILKHCVAYLVRSNFSHPDTDSNGADETLQVGIRVHSARVVGRGRVSSSANDGARQSAHA
jgi:hypothetical protein